MNEETQADALQLAQYHEIIGARVDGVGSVHLPFWSPAVPHGSIMDGRGCHQKFYPRWLGILHPVVDSAPCADSDEMCAPCKRSFISQLAGDVVGDQCHCVSEGSVIHHESTHVEAPVAKVAMAPYGVGEIEWLCANS